MVLFPGRAIISVICVWSLLVGIVQARESNDLRPNFLVIVADDLGFSDLGAFGSEIETPNLDSLAFNGARMTSFYAAPSCSPSRSMLLTGRDNHRVGLGNMAETMLPSQGGRPGYEGYLNGSITIAELLGEAGYATMMSGKWHLGAGDAQTPARHGFERSLVLLGGAANHFGYDQGGAWVGSMLEARYRLDGKAIARPVGVFSDDYFTDQMIGFLKEPVDAQQPFFAYLAFTSPHWPLQAPKQLIEKYWDRYGKGPGDLLSSRVARMKYLGLVPDDIDHFGFADFETFDQLSTEERIRSARLMAVYAAMVENLDTNVGRVLEFLRERQALENTVIVFLSDNGAEGMDQDNLNRFIRVAAPSSEVVHIHAANNDIEKIGTADSFLVYGSEWAHVSSFPFRMYKGFMFEGGIRTPAFISGPGIAPGQVIGVPLSIRDILPTALDIAGIPKVEPEPYGGVSWRPLFKEGNTSVRSSDSAIAWELALKRGIRRGDWKAVYDGDAPLFPGDPRTFKWRLFNVVKDPGERVDLSHEYPELLATMVQVWQDYANRNGVYIHPEVIDSTLLGR